MSEGLIAALREAAKDRAQMERETPGAYPRPPRQHIEWQAADRIEALERELAEAVAAERERCAGIAENAMVMLEIGTPEDGPFTRDDRAVDTTRATIAAAIRTGEAEQ